MSLVSLRQILALSLISCHPGVPMKEGDRVVVKSGPFAGRHGTISITEQSPYARYVGLAPGQVRVALDGARGKTMAEGGAGGEGGQPIDVEGADLEAE